MMMAGLIFICFGIFGFFEILFTVGLWKLFEKAGQPGWYAIIPIFRMIVLLQVAGRPWWWLLLFIIPIVNIVFVVMFWNSLSTNFGKGTGFTIGLFFFNFIFIPILGFGSATYKPVIQNTEPQLS